LLNLKLIRPSLLGFAQTIQQTALLLVDRVLLRGLVGGVEEGEVAPEEEDERGCTSERSERRGRGGGGARGGEKEPEGSGTKSRVAEGMGDGMDEGHTGEDRERRRKNVSTDREDRQSGGSLHDEAGLAGNVIDRLYACDESPEPPLGGK